MAQRLLYSRARLTTHRETKKMKTMVAIIKINISKGINTNQIRIFGAGVTAKELADHFNFSVSKSRNILSEKVKQGSLSIQKQGKNYKYFIN